MIMSGDVMFRDRNLLWIQPLFMLFEGNVPTSYEMYWGSRYYASDSFHFDKAEDISHP